MIVMAGAWLIRRPIILAILTALLVGGPAYLAGEWVGARQERSQAELRGAKITIQRLKERGLINEAISNEPDCDLIRELNPDSVCERNG